MAEGPARRRQLQRLARQQQALAEQAARLARHCSDSKPNARPNRWSRPPPSNNRRRRPGSRAIRAAPWSRPAQAERLLDAGGTAIGSERRQAEQDLFQEQMARLEKELQGLISRQESLLATTTELEGLAAAAGGRSAANNWPACRDLAAQQRSLAGEASGWPIRSGRRKRLPWASAAPGRRWSGRRRQLDVAETGEPPSSREQQALTRLQQLLEALKRDPAKPNHRLHPARARVGSNRVWLPAEAIQRLAELKLLKLMQEEIHRRTRELEAARVRQGTLSEEQNRELAELAQQQGRLADLLLNLSQPKEAPGSRARIRRPKTMVSRT